MKDAMDKLLREALGARGRDGAPPTACLDADTAAALADGALPPRDRHAAEAHLADCVRCQAMVAALARTLPPVPPRVWWRRPAFVWLAPLTAVGAALVVWAAVPQRESTPLPAQPSAAATQSESGPSAAPPGRKEESREQQQQQLARSEAVPLNAPSPPAAASPGGLTALRAPAANDQRELSSQRDAELMRQRTFADSSAKARAIAPPPAPASPALGEPPAAVGGAAPAPPTPQPLPSTPLPTSSAGAGAAAGDAAAPQMLTESVLIAPSTARQSLAQFKTSAATIISPDGSSQWRIGGGRTVQHSADGGATWQTQATGINVPLAGGMAPAKTVCGLVGSRGTVLLTVNEGRSWQRLNFPVAVDLRSVQATDDKTATVVAADGRVFSTADGGTTWQTR